MEVKWKNLNRREAQKILKDLKRKAEHFGVMEIGIFGSYVRGEAKETSDVDILVDFHRVPSLLEFIRFEEYLEDLLGVRVDLVMKSELKPRISEQVKREIIYVL